MIKTKQPQESWPTIFTAGDTLHNGMHSTQWTKEMLEHAADLYGDLYCYYGVPERKLLPDDVLCRLVMDPEDPVQVSRSVESRAEQYRRELTWCYSKFWPLLRVEYAAVWALLYRLLDSHDLKVHDLLHALDNARASLAPNDCFVSNSTLAEYTHHLLHQYLMPKRP
jgi:hypothetical protein